MERNAVTKMRRLKFRVCGVYRCGRRSHKQGNLREGIEGGSVEIPICVLCVGVVQMRGCTLHKGCVIRRGEQLFTVLGWNLGDAACLHRECQVWTMILRVLVSCGQHETLRSVPSYDPR